MIEILVWCQQHIFSVAIVCLPMTVLIVGAMISHG